MRFFIYLLRWIISGIVMFPLMQLLAPYIDLWFNLLLGQIFGAIVFYQIDKRIFKQNE